MNIDVDIVRNKTNSDEQKLHELKQSGELYRWKEHYKKDKLPKYYLYRRKADCPKSFIIFVPI
jgi:hypothetical protein